LNEATGRPANSAPSNEWERSLTPEGAPDDGHAGGLDFLINLSQSTLPSLGCQTRPGTLEKLSGRRFIPLNKFTTYEAFMDSVGAFRGQPFSTAPITCYKGSGIAATTKTITAHRHLANDFAIATDGPPQRGPVQPACRETMTTARIVCIVNRSHNSAVTAFSSVADNSKSKIARSSLMWDSDVVPVSGTTSI
jgi:hypothetical protein